MSARRFDDFESGVDEFIESQDNFSNTNPTTKLERRRLIEDMMEEKILREELGDYEVC